MHWLRIGNDYCDSLGKPKPFIGFYCVYLGLTVICKITYLESTATSEEE